MVGKKKDFQLRKGMPSSFKKDIYTQACFGTRLCLYALCKQELQVGFPKVLIINTALLPLNSEVNS